MTRVLGRFTCLVLLVAALALPAGCTNKSDAKVAQLSGTVKFKGEPVPAGYIQFMPDASKGGQGMVKTARIKNGKYDTSLSEPPGVNPGPTIIKIVGYDGKKVPLYAEGKQVFNPHEIKDTIAEGTSTKDFTVPESAAENLKYEPYSEK
jgi:hypothetical protein